MAINQWNQQAITWVLAAGAKIRQTLNQQLIIEQKSDRNDLVTNMDKEIEQFFKDKIDTLATHRLLGEEGHFLNELSGYVWILDPIDGTMNFVISQQNFAISLALYHDAQPLLGLVYDVMRDQLYHVMVGQGAFCNQQRIAQIKTDLSIKESFILCDFKEIDRLPCLRPLLLASRGHRRYGSAALEIVEVALGRAAAFLHLCVSPWDIAAAKIIAQECGARYTRLDGCSVNLLEKGSALVATPLAHHEILTQCYH